MQILTFTQKLLRQRSFFSSLIPLLALFVGLGSAQSVSAQGPAIDDAEVIFSQQPTGAPTTMVRYSTPGSLDAPYTGFIKLGTANPSTVTPNLGTYDISGNNTSSLIFTGGSVVAEPTGRSPQPTPTGARVRYRVYLVGTSVGDLPAFSVLTLGNPRPFPTFPAATLYDASTSVNLLNGLLGGGTYVFESNFEADYSNGTVQGATGNPYSAMFEVTSPPVTPAGGTTTWIATVSTEWTSAANWSNGVPTQFANAIIPEKNSTNANTSTPALLNPNPTLYNVRTITLNGTSNATRGLLRIGQTLGSIVSGATLNVYGDLNTFSGGVLASQTGANGVQNAALNSTIALRGDVQQVVRGLLEVSDITIGGTGNKLVVNSINTGNTFTFLPGTTARVRTVTESINPTTLLSTFSLNTTKTSNVDLKSTGILFGEKNDAYIEGVALADRNLQAGVMQTFGNIGVDITPNRDIPGQTVQITRTVGDPLSGPVGRNARPVKRQYGVSGDVNNAPTVSTLVFHYLDSPDELNGNAEPNLIIFRTTNNGIPYGIIGGTVDVAANTVTKTDVRAINTITLGDSQNPLPVSLTAFNAKRVGTDALVTWETASELNSRGYDVQVSTTGKEFRTLTSVPSASPNTTRTTQYRYIDTESNKVGTRYYRLRQVDLDGKEAFFSPVAVSFTGKATESALVAYPNPFNGTEQLHLTYQSATAGKGQLRITDLTGRVVRQQSLDMTAGTTDLAVEQLGDLGTGLYLVRLTMPSGQTQNLKVVKQ